MADERPPKQSIQGNHNIQAGGDITFVVPPRKANPADLQKVISKLGEIVDELMPNPAPTRPAGVEEKIGYNAIVANADFIREYGAYGHAVESAYNAVDHVIPTARVRIARFLRSLYHTLARSSRNLSSDEILEEISHDLKARLADQLPAEVLEPGCDMLIAQAFIHCTILKNPANHVDP